MTHNTPAPVADKALAERLARLAAAVDCVHGHNADVFENALTDAHRSGQLITLAEAQAMVAVERAIWTAALDPNETKAAYIGEVKMPVEIWGEDEEGDLVVSSHQVPVDWTATKDTMKMIAAQVDLIRAAATGTKENR